MNKFHEVAKSKGWHDEPVNVPTALALIHSEVSEALEDYREGKMALDCEVTGTVTGRMLKPVGFPSELADVVIRCYDLAGALGIDLDHAIDLKHEFNKTRTHRHGGKVC